MLRLCVLLVLLAVLGMVYLLVHAYAKHESIQHVWSQIHGLV